MNRVLDLPLCLKSSENCRLTELLSALESVITFGVTFHTSSH